MTLFKAKLKNITLFQTQNGQNPYAAIFSGGRQGGGSPREGLQEAGEERAGGGSLQGAGSKRPH